MKLHLPKLLRLAVLSCLAVVGISNSAASTDYTWSTADAADKGAYFGFAVALDSDCLTVNPAVSSQVSSLYLNSLTLQTRDTDNKSYADIKIAVYEYTSDGTTGTYLGVSSAKSFALASDITFEFTEALQLSVGSTYQFLFVAADTEADLTTYEGYKESDRTWGIKVTGTQDALSANGWGLYTSKNLALQNRTFVGALSTVGYDTTKAIISQDFTQATELPEGWTSGQWRNGWNTPHFRFDATKGLLVNVSWKQNSLEKAVTLSPANRYQISFTTYSETADKGCIFYMSSADYTVAMGQSYTSSAYVSVGYLEEGVISRGEDATVDGAKVISFQPPAAGEEHTRLIPTLFDDTAKSEGSNLDNEASLAYEVILDGTYLSVSVTDGTETWKDEFTIKENVTFDKIGFMLDGWDGQVGIKDISIQETSYVDAPGGDVPAKGQAWQGGAGSWTDPGMWGSAEYPGTNGVANVLKEVDSQISLGGEQIVSEFVVNTNRENKEEIKTTTLKDGKLTAEEVSLKSGKLEVASSAELFTNMLNGGEDAVLSGKIQILLPERARISKIGVYTGKYENAEVALKRGTQILAPGAGLTVTGGFGTAILRYAETAGMDQIATNGATVVLDRSEGATLNLSKASTMQGGTLEINMTDAEIASGKAELTAGETLKLDGTKLQIVTGSGADNMVLPGVTDVFAKTTITSDAALDVQFDSKAYTKYYSGVKMENGVLRFERNTSYYTDNLKADTEAGAFGVALANQTFLEKNPQATNPEGTMAKVLNTLDEYIASGASAKAVDELGEALTGAGTAVLGMALSGDVERQLKSIRNRTTSMGVDQSVVNGDLPYYNAWFNAEGGQQRLREGDTADGYTLDSWGGTVGFDVDLANTFTAGLALTAMYGDLSTTAADSTSGDLNTYYVSAFARAAFGAWTHTLVGTAGMADISLERMVAGDKIEGDTNATSFGLMYEVGRVIALDEEGETCIQPVFNVAWRHTTMDAYTESSSDAALAVAEQTMDTVTFGLGARLQTVAGQTAFNRTCIFECRAMVKADTGDRSSKTDVELSGYKASAESVERGAVGLELGAGYILPTGNDAGNIFVDASLDFRAEYTDVNAAVGYRMNF